MHSSGTGLQIPAPVVGKSSSIFGTTAVSATSSDPIFGSLDGTGSQGITPLSQSEMRIILKPRKHEQIDTRRPTVGNNFTFFVSIFSGLLNKSRSSSSDREPFLDENRFRVHSL